MQVSLVLYAYGVGLGGDVGQDGALKSTPAWFLLPASFEVEVVL
jgi:hypothetical protein